MVFNTALSGIQAATKDLEVIGNNIANSGTIGFKGSRSEFSDIYTSAAYGAGSNAVGGGVRLSRVHQSFETGTLSPTNNTLDLAVSDGSGFFILSDNGAKVYTRAGQFKLDDENFVVNGSGQKLQGMLADANGNITGASGSLKVNTANISPRATTNVNLGVNLYGKTTPAATDWTGGATPGTDSYNNVNSSTIYDSLGNSHVLTTYFIKGNADPAATTNVGADNQWYIAFQIDNVDVPMQSPWIGSPPPSGANLDNLASVTFDSAGKVSTVSTPVVPGTPSVTEQAIINSKLVPVTLTLTNGAAPLSFTLNLNDSTQFGTPFAVQSANNDGYTTGSLAGLDISATGVVSGRYTNGQSLAMGQIQLASFADPEGLKSLGNTSWAETGASGQPIVGPAGGNGLGEISSGFLEESNVDLTSELVQLINAQRNFQANAQTIRTADAITQTIINIR